MAFKKTILIDLDGVLNTYTGNFNKEEIPSIKEGAKEFLEELSNNYEIKLFTTRDMDLAQKWILDNKLENLIVKVTEDVEKSQI